MSDGIASIKHFFEVAVSSVTAQPQGVRGPIRGKDFMLDDMTFGADRDEH